MITKISSARPKKQWRNLQAAPLLFVYFDDYNLENNTDCSLLLVLSVILIR